MELEPSFRLKRSEMEKSLVNVNELNEIFNYLKYEKTIIISNRIDVGYDVVCTGKEIIHTG
jgi:hypothetical protein